MQHVGAFLGVVRTDRCVPIKAVAIAAGCDPSLISRIEKGERSATDNIVSAYAIETGIRELELLKNNELSMVVGIYLGKLREEKLMRFVEEMQRLPERMGISAGA